MFKSHYITSYHTVLRKYKVCTCKAPVNKPDCSATVLAAKMCTNSHEHSMNIRFLRALRLLAANKTSFKNKDR
jgi:hypothetical protein